MNNKSRKRWFIIGGGVLFLLLTLGGIWWLQRSRTESSEVIPLENIHVFLVSPASGDEVNAGDLVPVILQLFGTEEVLSVELFINDLSQGTMINILDSAYWVWQPWEFGIHKLTARVNDINGEIYNSQTIFINVLEGAGLIQVSAEQDQTILDIGNTYAIPPEQMGQVNSYLDTNQPLPDGQTVIVPIGDMSAGDQQNQIDTIVSFPTIAWKFTPLEPIDKSYCYLTSGDGNWIKLPKKPFSFFSEPQMTYLQIEAIPIRDNGVIQVECWGWLGEKLKYLGQGEAELNAWQLSDQLIVIGQGFQITGTPITPISDSGGVPFVVPEPYAIRKAENPDECTKNFGNPVGAIVCDAIMNDPWTLYFVLLWEWQPRTCTFNQPECPWFNDIKGYRLYSYDEVTQSLNYLKEVSHSKQKASVLPLPWAGVGCFGVQAYTDDTELEWSTISTYCFGDEQPKPSKTVLSPVDWLTSDYMWYTDGDCDTYGSGNYTGGASEPKVLVSSWIVDNNDKDCFRQGDSAAAVKFDVSKDLFLPEDAIIHKALLKYSHYGHEYKATGLATNLKPSCVYSLGTSLQDWTGLSSNHGYYSSNILKSSQFYLPFKTTSDLNYSPAVDVTILVNNWIKSPTSNHGFILFPTTAPNPIGDGVGTCYSYLSNFQLEIYYFDLPN